MTGDPDAILSTRGDGESLRNPVGGPLEIKAGAARTGAALTAFESVAAPGEGPPLHLHAAEDEIIYFLDGHFRMRIGGELRDAPAGSFAFIPKGLEHTWQNIGDRPARLLAVFVPASPGMEGFFARFAELDDPGPDAFTTLAEDAGMKVLGPPLAVSDPL
jgi:quercetin dioxygenase-like cupin family protein